MTEDINICESGEIDKDQGYEVVWYDQTDSKDLDKHRCHMMGGLTCCSPRRSIQLHLIKVPLLPQEGL